MRRLDLTGLVVAGLAILLGAFLTHRGAAATGELRLDIWWSQHRPPWLSAPSRVLAHYGVGLHFYLAACAFVALVWRKAGARDAIVTLLVFLAGVLSSTIAKPIYHRARPPADVVHALVPVHDHTSMPSGHTALAAACAGALIYGIYRCDWPVPPAVLVGACWTVAMGISRMVVGAHYLGDVVVGVLLPAGVMLIVVGVFGRWSPQRENPRTATALSR